MRINVTNAHTEVQDWPEWPGAELEQLERLANMGLLDDDELRRLDRVMNQMYEYFLLSTWEAESLPFEATWAREEPMASPVCQ
ncbi:MAG: hypothetical protein HQL56_02265 [Magnetococcales bacterium]|nr:hypothetical protein [Magnetococcales bacterium]